MAGEEVGNEERKREWKEKRGGRKEALIDNDIHASFKDISIQLIIHLPLSVKCVIVLTV